ncbi:MAG: helix-turn-helix transcriptional regulator [Bacilli bacterium]
MLYQLQAERKKRKMTQADMARIIDKEPLTYFRKENGHNDFTDAEKIKILEAFGLPFEKIYIFFENRLTF